MTLEDLRTLLDYHYWARDRMLEAVEPLTPEQFNQDLGSSFRSVRETLVHLYSAEWAWHSRWQGVSPTSMLSLDGYPDVAALQVAWTVTEQNVRNFVEAGGEQGVQRVFEYKTLAGVAGRSPLWQMVQHVVNHGSYHRGQVTTMLRQLGAKPSKSMDLVAFYRVSLRTVGGGQGSGV